MRDGFRSAFEAWLEKRPLTNADAPPIPFATEEYRLEVAIAADAKLKGGQSTYGGCPAGQSELVLTAVALAVAILFAGVSSKLSTRRNRWFAIASGL